MPSCVLRVSGSTANVRNFLSKTKWKPIAVYIKGQPAPTTCGRPAKVSGFNVVVSRGGALKAQIRAVRAFLKQHRSELNKLRRHRLTEPHLDFGIHEVFEEMFYLEYAFPNVLMKDMTKHGLSLGLCVYPVSSKERRKRGNTRKTLCKPPKAMLACANDLTT